MLLAVLFAGCQEKTDPFSTQPYSDVVINEIAANDGNKYADTWVEIANNSDQEKDLFPCVQPYKIKKGRPHRPPYQTA